MDFFNKLSHRMGQLVFLLVGGGGTDPQGERPPRRREQGVRRSTDGRLCPPEMVEPNAPTVAPGSGSEAVAERGRGTVLWTDNVDWQADCVWKGL